MHVHIEPTYHLNGIESVPEEKDVEPFDIHRLRDVTVVDTNIEVYPNDIIDKLEGNIGGKVEPMGVNF